MYQNYHFTTETQLPQFLTPNRMDRSVKVLTSAPSHKWFGCKLTFVGSKCTNINTEYYIQAANRIFHANRIILRDKNVSIHRMFRYSHAILTPVACFGTGPTGSIVRTYNDLISISETLAKMLLDHHQV